MSTVKQAAEAGGPLPSRPARMLSAQMVADRLQVDVTTVRRLAELGAFPGARRKSLSPRGHWLIPPAGVEAFVKARTAGPRVPALPVSPDLLVSEQPLARNPARQRAR